MSSVNIKSVLPKNTPQEYSRLLQESFDGKYKMESFEDKNAIDKAIHQGKTFVFRCEVTADDYSIMKFGKLGLIIVCVLFVLLLIFGDFQDSLFLILGLAPLFMMGIIAYGYFNNGRNRVRYKPEWFLIIGPKGFLFKNIEYLEYMEWIQILKMAERVKSHKNVQLDMLGVEIIAFKHQYSLDFNVYDLKTINFKDPIGKTGRENLMYLIKKIKDR